MGNPIVGNAADKGQVQAAKVKEKLGRQAELNDVMAILAIPEGRRFLWRCLGKAKVFETIWVSSAQIHYNAGMQDFGHFIMAEIIEAKPDGFLQMMMEAKAADSAEPDEKEQKEKEK